jgi:hypothetical protein
MPDASLGTVLRDVLRTCIEAELGNLSDPRPFKRVGPSNQDSTHLRAMTHSALQGYFRDLELPSLAIDPNNANNPYVAWNDGGTNMSDGLSPTKSYHFADILSRARPTVVRAGQLARQSTAAPAPRPTRTNRRLRSRAAAGSRSATTTGDPHNFLIQRYCAAKGWAGFGTPAPITDNSAPAFFSVIGQDFYVAFDYMGDYDTLMPDSSKTNTSVFLGAFGDNATGDPEVRAHNE